MTFVFLMHTAAIVSVVDVRVCRMLRARSSRERLSTGVYENLFGREPKRYENVLDPRSRSENFRIQKIQKPFGSKRYENPPPERSFPPIFRRKNGADQPPPPPPRRRRAAGRRRSNSNCHATRTRRRPQLIEFFIRRPILSNNNPIITMAAVAQQYHEEALEAQGENMEVSFERGVGVERVVVVAMGVRVSFGSVCHCHCSPLPILCSFGMRGV